MMDNALAPSSVREDKLEEWIVSYGDDILKTCFLFLTDAALAEDATQDTFFKAWQNMNQFEGRNHCSEKTWLIRIAINTCKNYKRSAWYRYIDLTKVIEDLPASFHAVSQEDKDFFLDIVRLPQRYKQVIILHYYQDIPMAEVADMLRISRSTAYHRLQKAQQMLRITLEGGYIHEAE
jgi:RNA polymerase sigma-70 factor (ECF subfamily)